MPKAGLGVLMMICFSGAVSADEVIVDCAKPGPADLVKKFDMCQTGWSPPDKWMAAAKGRLAPIKCRHIRIVGALLHRKWGGTPLNNETLLLMRSEGAAPYVCMDPNVLEEGRMLEMPKNMRSWRMLVQKTAFQARRFGGVYFEVWNEPNYPNFWKGTQEQLFQMYKVMVEEVSRVHPEPRFAGPGITSAGIPKWIGPFLDYVERENLPLHAVSFHDFGRDYTLADRWIMEHVGDCLKELDKRPYFKDRNVEIHVGECSFFGDPKNGDEADRAKAAAHLPGFFKILIEEPRLTLVQWAQLFDTGSKGQWGNLGVIDLESRRQKPVYNVFMMYAMMPEKSIYYEEKGNIGCLAGSDGDTVAVMLYNTSEEDRDGRLRIRNLPFRPGRRVYVSRLAVDEKHSSFWDTPGTGRLELVSSERVKAPSGDDEEAGLLLEEPVPGPGVRLILLDERRRRFDPKVVIEAR